MALTPFRWVALAAIGCMLAVVALVSLAERRPVYPYEMNTGGDTAEARLRQRAGALNREAQLVAGRYRMVSLMDSVARATARVPDTGVFRLFIANGYTPETRALIETRIRAARNARRGELGRVDVFVVSDTPKVIRGVPRHLPATEVRYQFPETAGGRCRVFIRTFYPGDIRAAFTSEKSVDQILGPCGYYAAFGAPGPAIAQWITNGGWQYTIEGSWTTAPPKLMRREDEGIFKGPAPATWLLNVESGATECMKGDLAVCERMVTIRPPSRWLGPTIGSGTYALSLGRNRYFKGAIGFEAGQLMSDVVREVGRDRFAKFWSSPDSLPVAYEKATGERWGAFLQRWMIAHYGELEPGPRMSGYALLTSTLLVILALGATMMKSVNRTYV